jgi:hypothetical protein
MTSNLELEFDKFFDQVYKISHDTDQYREMKKVWYSAMFLLFTEILLVSKLPDPLNEKGLGLIRNQINKGMKQAISR